jgi:NADH-quinone oxidoreductase subunit A
MTALVFYLVLFLAVGFGFIFVHLIAGKFFRPIKPDAEKLTIYECGEPTIGSAWVQFDLRYYVVALLFVIFDVEVAFFFPWAVVFGHAIALAKETDSDRAPISQRAQRAEIELLGRSGTPVTTDEQQAARKLAWLAFWDIAVFFGVLLVGFAYLWKRGDLNWVRSTISEKVATVGEGAPPDGARPSALVTAGLEDW